MQKLQESVHKTEVECRGSLSETENVSTPACGVDITDEILATSDPCNASSSQSPRDKQNETEMIKRFKNQARLLKSNNRFEWWDK